MTRIFITFGNQKGGVGKTTLCTVFANFLVQRGLTVSVVDCDGQQTIYEKRAGDLELFKGQKPKYTVTPYSLVSDAEKTNTLMNTLAQSDDIILFDSPGNLAQNGLVPLFGKSHYIVCPYQFEFTSINSTVTFVSFINKIKAHFGTDSPRLIFVPNKYDQRRGIKTELELWAQTEAAFAAYGTNAPRVKDKACMTRYNTLMNNDEISAEVKPTFEFIYNLIFNPTHHDINQTATDQI